MSGKREQHKQQTRQAILDAARLLFPQQGFDQTRIEDLARQARIGKGTIYSYFDSKEQILIELLADNRLQIMDQFRQQNDPQSTVPQQLMTLFLCQFDFCRQHKELARLMFRESMFPAQPTMDHRHQVDLSYLQAVMEILATGQKRAEIAAELDLLSGAIVLHAHYCMAVSGWYIGYYDSDQFTHNLRQLITLALNGYAGTNSPESSLSSPLQIAQISPTTEAL
ncbi:MAG: TetR/AcrR family transcriptional regulator [Desulfuromonas sp.]|nr:TetR/AcrR family transcriptional regulator [Desulfuromonas sp.]